MYSAPKAVRIVESLRTRREDVLTQDATTAYKRLLQALSVNTQVEAAKLLGVPQSLLSDCKRRGETVTESILSAAGRRGINPDWLRYGTFPIFSINHARKTPPETYPRNAVPPHEPNADLEDDTARKAHDGTALANDTYVDYIDSLIQ